MGDLKLPVDLSYRHKSSAFERVFGKVARGFMVAANPFKKFAFKTPCLMHRYINIRAIKILENEGYLDEADFYRDMIRPLNEGAVWIDQDFKSTNHFYHYEKHKGLYGFSDTLTESLKYKEKVEKHIANNNLVRALFYTGVICHLTQDMTVPQHINNKLLESHRDYEVWILQNAWDKIDFAVDKGIISYDLFSQYISENAMEAHKLSDEAKNIVNREERYKFLATNLIARTQRSTAGLLLDFYHSYFKAFDNKESREIVKEKEVKLEEANLDNKIPTDVPKL